IDSRVTVAIVSNRSPSRDRATTTAYPRPFPTGRRTRYARWISPSAATALGAPAQYPSPVSGGDTATTPREGSGNSLPASIDMGVRLGDDTDDDLPFGRSESIPGHAIE